MSYDVGIGRCAKIGADFIVVELDSVMVKKLLPEHPWRKSGTSLLSLNVDACSSTRPPEVGSEVYISRETLAGGVKASLDLFGNGSPTPVDLRQLLKDMSPQMPPEPNPRKFRRW